MSSIVTKRKSESSKKKPSEESSKSKKVPFSGRYNPKTEYFSTWLSKLWTPKSLSKIVLVTTICIIGVLTCSHKKGKTLMAKQSEVLSTKRYQVFLCAPSYKTEIQSHSPNCAPSKCGRVVLDDLIHETSLNTLLKIAKKGLEKGGSSGGASILDLHSGALSKETQFINIYKTHPNLFTSSDFAVYKNVKNIVKENIEKHFKIKDLYLTHPTFFSRITSKAPQTEHDEYWHDHVDSSTYPNFHYTSLLYLTDYGIDFKGGEFVFVDGADKYNRTIEPKFGRVSFFTSGIENKHHVERVTDGIRYALTLGFTCDPSKAIEDPGMHGK